MWNLLEHDNLKQYLKNSALSIVMMTFPIVALADSGGPVAEMVVRGATGLALCLAVFSIGVFLMKRTSRQVQSTKREIIIKERVAISSKMNATLVEIRGQTYLMISGSEHVSITQMPMAEPTIQGEGLRILPSERLFRVGGE